MAKSGKSGKQQPPPVGGPGRADTDFFVTSQFTKAREGLGKPHSARILADIQQFERQWKASKTDADILPGFRLKQLYASSGEYRVAQIYVGLDHRAAITFLIRQGRAYWIHTWKKTAMNNRAEIDTSLKRAKALWNQVVAEEKGKSK